MVALPKTTSRVTESTAGEVNRRIQKETEAQVEKYCGADKETLARRLEELDHEWDIERLVEVGASVHVLVGIALGLRVDRRFLGWSALIAGFMIIHALFGWLPVLPVLRRMGVRTEAEIEEERTALRILRGDFHPTENPKEALAQARLSLGSMISGASISDHK